MAQKKNNNQHLPLFRFFLRCQLTEVLVNWAKQCLATWTVSIRYSIARYLSRGQATILPQLQKHACLAALEPLPHINSDSFSNSKCPLLCTAFKFEISHLRLIPILYIYIYIRMYIYINVDIGLSALRLSGFLITCITRQFMALPNLATNSWHMCLKRAVEIQTCSR